MVLSITDNSPMISTTSSTVEMVTQEKLQRNEDNVEGKCLTCLSLKINVFYEEWVVKVYCSVKE